MTDPLSRVVLGEKDRFRSFTAQVVQDTVNAHDEQTKSAFYLYQDEFEKYR
jgi:hypothetical protein